MLAHGMSPDPYHGMLEPCMGLCKGSLSCLTIPPVLPTQHRAPLEGLPNRLPEERWQSRLGAQTPAPSSGFAKSLERGLSQTSQAAAHRGCNMDLSSLCVPLLPQKKWGNRFHNQQGALGGCFKCFGISRWNGRRGMKSN